MALEVLQEGNLRHRRQRGTLRMHNCLGPSQKQFRQPSDHRSSHNAHAIALRSGPMQNSPLISAGEVAWITVAVECNCRNDGRQREDYRPLSVQLGVLAQATGSARVQLGEADVIVGVKVREGQPAWPCCSNLARRCRRRLLPPTNPTPLPLFPRRL